MSHIAERYLDLFAGDGMSRRALLACAAALRWDDGSAKEAIELVAESNGSTESLLRRIKGLSCVWRQWDGTWYLTDEVRTYLANQFDAEVPEQVRYRLHEILSARAEKRLASLSPDGAITIYRVRTARIERAYQKAFIPGQEQEAGQEFGEAWLQARGSAKPATSDAIARIGDELEARRAHLPDEVLFLRGMSLYQRRHRREAEKDFRVVYERGRPGTIYAIAAHLFGKLINNHREAKRALHRSILWHTEPEGRAHTWHSLGNLLSKSKDRRSWLEAELAYRRSLALLHDPEHLGQVWHSLGNVLSKNRNRWSEAEAAYHRSLALRHDPEHQGQVWHSLGNFLSKDRNRWSEAEAAYHRSLALRHAPEYEGQVRASYADALMKGGPNAYDQAEKLALEARSLDPHNPTTCGVANRVLVDIYQARGQFDKAIEALEALEETNRKLGVHNYQERTQTRLKRLKQLASGETKV